MAPRGRGRQRKRGNTRMDAALDAMSPLGFPGKCVRQTVKELLKVYGGDDGWVFIEEAAYKLLIETMLDNQKNASPERVGWQDDAIFLFWPISKVGWQDDARSLKYTETSIAGPSCEVVEPICSEIEAANTNLLTAADTALECVLHRTEALDFQPLSIEAGTKDDKIPSNGEEGTGSLKDVQMGLDFGKKDVNNVEETQTDKHLCVKDSEKDKDPANTIIQSTKPADFLSPRKRKPFHGWICKDGEEDLVGLTPEPLSEVLKKFLRMNKKTHSGVGCTA